MEPVLIGPKKFQGKYSREKGIVFDEKPYRPWQYMATGTGRTRIAVLACDPLIL